jgi:hypothetical protein
MTEMNRDEIGARSETRFASVLVLLFVLMGLAAALWSWGFSDGRTPLVILAKALSVNWFAAAGLLVFHRRLRSFGAALLLVMALLVAISFVAQYWLLLLVAVALSGVAYVDRRGAAGAPCARGTVVGLAIGASILGLVTLAGHAWGNYIGPDIEQNVLAGNIHLDSTYHAAIATMLREFWKVSTGLHGPHPIVYHAFSHFLFGRLSAATSLSVLDTYGVAQCVVFGPLLLLAVLWCAEEIAPSPDARALLVRVGCVAIIFIGPLGYWYEGDFGCRFALHDVHMESESYTLALIFFLAMIGLLGLETARWRWPVVFGLLICAAAAKVSMGAIATGMLGLYLLFFAKNRRLFLICAVVMAVVGAAFVVPFLHYRQKSSGFTISLKETFQFPKYNGEVPIETSPRNLAFWYPMARFSGVHFLYSWLFFLTAAAIGWWRRAEWPKHKEAWVLNLGALLAGLVAIAILPVRSKGGIGGDVYYFSNPAMFVALPWLLIVLSNQLASLSPGRGGRGWWCGAIVVVALVCGDVVHGPRYLGAWRKRVVAEPVVPATPDFPKYVTNLLQIRDDASTRGFLVYIAKEEHDFWAGGQPAYFGQVSLLIPAISERAAIYGLPTPDYAEVEKRKAKRANLDFKDSGFFPQGYGYPAYERELYEAGAVPRVPSAALEAETRRLGFKGYIDVTAKGWAKHAVAAP